MWIVGAIIAAAGMQVYIIWGVVRDAALLSPHLKSLSSAGPAVQWRRKELPRVSVSETKKACNIYVRRKRRSFRYFLPLTFCQKSSHFSIAWGAGNSLVFAEYAIASISPASMTPSSLFSPVRLLAFFCLTGVTLLHGLHIPTGLRLQNLLGVLKLGILLIAVGTGAAALSGFLQVGVPRPNNFGSWQTIWQGSRGGGNVICACLYSVSYLSTL